jgi:hypothetical protein
LTVQKNGNGVVNEVPAHKASYACNESVTLTAIADEDNVFLRWEGNASGSTNPLEVFMTRSKTITAIFAEGGFIYLPLVRK